MKVLIVDDSNFSQKITASLLKEYLTDLEIYFAANGQEGFQTYTEISPDFVFADLLMPELNGEGMIQLIREHDSKAKVIILSADVQKSVKTAMEKYGVIAFINKPFNHEKAVEICQVMKEESHGE